MREFSTSPLSMFYMPLIRTLRAASDTVVPRTRLRIIDEESPPVEVMKEVLMERVLKYLPTGNYKWCVMVVAFMTMRPLTVIAGPLSRSTPGMRNTQN